LGSTLESAVDGNGSEVGGTLTAKAEAGPDHRGVRSVVEGFSFLESPRWHDGRLFMSDFYSCHVYACTEDGDCTQVCEVPGQPSGLGFTPNGELLVVSRIDKLLLRQEGRRVETLVDLGAAPGVLNDMVVDGTGRAYIGACVPPDESGSAPATDVMVVEPSGSVSVAAGEIVFPNGMVISPDGGTLLVAETFAHRISAFDIGDNGSLSNRRVWKDFAGPNAVLSTSRVAPGAPALPDGLALDEEGAVWVADAHGAGALRLASDGSVLEMVPTGDASVYAVALGGVDRRTLFLCVSAPLGVEDPATTRNSALLACRVDVPGAGLP
jgi:sugar lactone lactonase YvrE